MSSKESVPPLLLDIFPSRTLLAIAGVLHLLALCSLGILALPLSVTLGLGFLLGLSATWLGYRYASARSPGFVSRLEWSGDGRWWLHGADGRSHPAWLVGRCALPRLLVLNFALASGIRRSVVILTDSGDPEVIRRFRVRLRAFRG